MFSSYNSVLGIIDGITIQIENIHVDVDLQPNINVIIDIGNPIASLFDLLVRLVGAHGGPSSADVIARIEEGFKRINDRLSAFEHRLEQLFDELKLVIQLALYHPIRTDIHLLLNELHDTLQKPSPSAVTRFITKVRGSTILQGIFVKKLVGYEQLNSKDRYEKVKGYNSFLKKNK